MAAASSDGNELEQAAALDGEDVTLAEVIGEAGEGTEFAKAALGMDVEGPDEAVKDLLSPQPLFVVVVVSSPVSSSSVSSSSSSSSSSPSSSSSSSRSSPSLLCLQDAVLCQMCGEMCPKEDCFAVSKTRAKTCKYKCKKCHALRSRMQRMFASKEPSHVD
jgi:hypothetical protein